MDSSSSMVMTVESVRLALNATGLRQRLIADNIANANSADHVRMKVVFEERLAQALQSISGAEDGSDALSALSDIEPEVIPASARGTPVQLDREMVDLSTNGLRYQALTKALGKYFQLASAISAPGRG